MEPGAQGPFHRFTPLLQERRSYWRLVKTPRSRRRGWLRVCTLRGGPHTLPGAPDTQLPGAFPGPGARKGSSATTEQQAGKNPRQSQCRRGRRNLAAPRGPSASAEGLPKRLLIQEPFSLRGTFLPAPCSHPPLPAGPSAALRGPERVCVASQTRSEPGTRHPWLQKPRSGAHTAVWLALFRGPGVTFPSHGRPRQRRSPSIPSARIRISKRTSGS